MTVCELAGLAVASSVLQGSTAVYLEATCLSREGLLKCVDSGSIIPDTPC